MLHETIYVYSDLLDIVGERGQIKSTKFIYGDSQAPGILAIISNHQRHG